MANLKAYLDHCKKKIERNMHDIKMNSSLIVKLFNLPVTRELIEETGLYKLIRNLCRREDEMGEKSLMVYKKWRKFYGDGVLTPANESISQSASRPPPSSIENIANPSSKCQSISSVQKELKHQSISKPDPKHLLLNHFKPEMKHPQLSSYKLEHPFSNLLAEATKHRRPQSVSESESKRTSLESGSKRPYVPGFKHQLSSPSKPEPKHMRISPSKPSTHPLSSPSKSDSKCRPSPSANSVFLPKPEVKHLLPSNPKPELRHSAHKVEPRFHPSSSVASESKRQPPRPDPKQRLVPLISKPETKHHHISASNTDFRHPPSSPQLDHGRHRVSSPSSRGGIRESDPSQADGLPSLPHRGFRPVFVDNNQSLNQKSHIENHSSSAQDKRHRPSAPTHPAFASGGHTTLHQKTVDKMNVQHVVDGFDGSVYCTNDEKPVDLFHSNPECGLDVLDALPQRNNDALIGQESRSSFGSENPESSLDITNGEKCDGTAHADAFGSSPTKRVFVEPYAIAMREGMFRVVKSKDKVPANILRLQQIYDREIMTGRPKRSDNPKSNEGKNSKKPADQTKSSDEGPSTPSKAKKVSYGAKGTPPKPKSSSSSTRSRPEAGQSGSNGKVKTSEGDKIQASKEMKKWLKIGESDDSLHSQKMRKSSHHQ